METGKDHWDWGDEVCELALILNMGFADTPLRLHELVADCVPDESG